MRTVRWGTALLAFVLAPALLGACGSPGVDPAAQDTASATDPDATASTQTDGTTAGPDGGPVPSSGPDGSDLPALPPPSGAPRTPTDLIPSGVLVGTIMADSDGSCYTLQTDDGDRYALVGGDRRPLAQGTVVRAKTTPDTPPAPSGCSGQPVAIASIEPV